MPSSIRCRLPGDGLCTTIQRMQIATGTVVDGKVDVAGLSLPEGTVVTILARGGEAPVRLTPELEAELLEALDDADREAGISTEEMLARLRRFG